MRPRLLLCVLILSIAPALGITATNRPPAAPRITMPEDDWVVVSPADVHMETAPFSDPDGNAHKCTDWEIWTVTPVELAWITPCIGGIERLHTHLGDGTFKNSHAGRFDLRPDTMYQLRVRHADAGGDPATQWSPWSDRFFRTEPALNGTPVPWTLRQPGYRLDVIAGGFQLPVNIAFVPRPGTSAASPLFYVAELYGTIKVVTRDFTVRTYASGLLNFNPTGNFPGSGEQGLTGLVVDGTTGDVFASMLNDRGGVHQPRVVRFQSGDGGLTSNRQTTIIDIAEPQGQSHQISNLSFGPDGRLYVHMGDGFDPAKAQSMRSFLGKILRLNRDGTPASDNPFYTAGDGLTAADYILALGFRNPFGGAWRLADSSLFEVENGPSVDRMARIVRGRNYRWDGTNASMASGATYNWSPAVAPVNITFIQPERFSGSGFPAGKMGYAYVSESGPTWATGPQAHGKRISEFLIDANGQIAVGPNTLLNYTGVGKATVAALAAGPDGLYFSELYKDTQYTSPTDRGARVLRIKYVGSSAVSPRRVPGTIQAEDYDSGGQGVGYRDTTAGNRGGVYRNGDVDIEPTVDAGGGYDVAWIVAGEWLAYSVDVAGAGTYALEGRVASRGAGGTFHVEVGGANVTGTLTIPDTGGWQNWTTLRRTVTLPAGRQRLRIVFDRPGPTGAVGNVNYVRLAAASGGQPYGGTRRALPGTIQAEDFDTGGEGLTFHDTTAGNRGGVYRQTNVDLETTVDGGGGYDVAWIAPGEWLAYSVDVRQAGSYVLDARVASNGTGGAFHVEVRGVNVTGSLAVPNTGGWQTWTTLRRTVTLPSGAQLLRIVFDSAGASGAVVNVNYVRVAVP
jgi:glucose/arabinose dehydrogenase